MTRPSSNGLVGQSFPYQFISTNLIPARFMVGDDKLVEDLDRSVLEGNGQFLLEGFQIIDESIREFRPFNIGSTELHLRRENENYMPLSMFGDAMSKVAYFILTIVNNKGGIVLLDEIENGIHYRHQEKLWVLLFKLCERFNVQIFAATHSYEMIQAYKNALETRDDASFGSYFEIYRPKYKPEKINIQKIPIEALLTQSPNVRGETESS
jgi:predicted ATPase